jgi:purine nucleosidase
MRRTVRRILGGLGLAAALLVLVLVVSFALPVRIWRTGELAAPPLPLVMGGPAVEMPKRVWIDTDAACGNGRTTDPDDCFALLLLAQAPSLEIAGISTVHGNAALEVTDRTTRDLAAALARDGDSRAAVFGGSASPLAQAPDRLGRAPAHAALERALEAGPLTLVALGPLTNLATVLRERPDLQANVTRLIAVMGRRPGHRFHPAEGTGRGGILFGHGPVFSDFNFNQDQAAAVSVLNMLLPTTLIPYEAARLVSLTGADVARIGQRGGPSALVASRATGWLEFWQKDIGRNGFYPFDLIAAAYVLTPKHFGCAASATAWIGKDRKLRNLIYDPDALLVGLERNKPADVRSSSSVVYCPQVDSSLHAWLMSNLTGERSAV